MFYPVPWSNGPGPATPFVPRWWDWRPGKRWWPMGVGVLPDSGQNFTGPYPSPELGPLIGTDEEWWGGLDYDRWMNDPNGNPNGCWKRGNRLWFTMGVAVGSPATEEPAAGAVEVGGSGYVVPLAGVAGLEFGGSYTLEHGLAVGEIAVSGYAAVTVPLAVAGELELGGSAEVLGAVALAVAGELELGGSADVVADAVYEALAGLEAGGSGAVSASVALAMLAGVELGGAGGLDTVVIGLGGSGVEVGGSGAVSASVALEMLAGVELGGAGYVGNVWPFAMGGGVELGGAGEFLFEGRVKGEILGNLWNATAESTTSTTAVLLTTPMQLTITLTATEDLLVFWYGQAYNTGLNINYASVYLGGVLVSGSETSVRAQTAGVPQSIILHYVLPAVASGSRTISIRNRVDAGTGTWRNQRLLILRG